MDDELSIKFLGEIISVSLIKFTFNPENKNISTFNDSVRQFFIQFLIQLKYFYF